MDLERLKLRESSQISYDIPYMWNLKIMIKMNLFTNQKETYRMNVCLPRVKGERDRLGVSDDKYTLPTRT